MKVFKYTFVLFTILLDILLGLALLSPYVRPDDLSIIGLLGIAEHILILANIFLLVIWLLLWNRWVFLPLLLFLLSFSRIENYISIQFSRHYDTEETRRLVSAQNKKNTLKVMAYNVCSFQYKSEILDTSLKLIESYDPDVLSIEEYDNAGKYTSDTIKARLKKLKYYASVSGIGKDMKCPHVILSRYPLINFDTLYAKTNHQLLAIMADMVINYSDTVKLITLHLNCTGFNSLNRDLSIKSYIEDTIDLPLEQTDVCHSDIVMDRVEFLLRKISQNMHIRSYQADTISTIIKNSKYKTIVMGDFNDTPSSYTTGTIIGDKLMDSFRAVDSTCYGYTFNRMNKLFRIDYVLFDKDKFELIDYKSPLSTISDHNPVIVILKRL